MNKKGKKCATGFLSGIFNSQVLQNIGKRRDLFAIIAIVAIVILIPTFLMDTLLAFNICTALIILLISIYHKKVSGFSAFPLLLIAVTLFRLSVNVASMRLILTQANAGKVIEMIGSFVTSGNMVVGVIIFLTLVLIQYIVITKGAGRIAEVAARFTLDAMPGKRMAIDFNLNAGLINEEQARARLSKIQRECDFYGAMDAASASMRGDAIAGIIITAINVIGGFIIGMVQMGMDWGEALSTYTRLAIGAGLISQLPALMILVGSVVIVNRAATENHLDTEIT